VVLLGGAGGKGVWGKPGSELDETGICSDIRDPNYDSDSQVVIVHSSSETSVCSIEKLLIFNLCL